jgi:hypothetical protein
MKPDRTLFWITTTFGIVITSLIIFAVVVAIIWEIEAAGDYFFKNLTNIFRFDLNNSILLYLIYLVGYGIAWRKSLLGSIIIIAVSLTGYIYAYSDERMSYVLIFLVGFFYLAYWYDGRKTKKIA